MNHATSAAVSSEKYFILEQKYQGKTLNCVEQINPYIRKKKLNSLLHLKYKKINVKVVLSLCIFLLKLILRYCPPLKSKVMNFRAYRQDIIIAVKDGKAKT